MVQEPYPHPPIESVSLADVLHALSDPLRLSILQTLAGTGEVAWSAFGGGVAPSTLSHHIKVLRNAGLISNRRDGTRCFVSSRPEAAERFPGLLEAVLRLAPR